MPVLYIVQNGSLLERRLLSDVVHRLEWIQRLISIQLRSSSRMLRLRIYIMM